MISCNLYNARVVERHLFDNMADEESTFLLLALVKKNNKMKNEKELTHFWFDMSSTMDNTKDSTQTLLMSFDCLIDALWEDFDRSIAETCFHTIADNRSSLLTIAIIWKLGLRATGY